MNTAPTEIDTATATAFLRAYHCLHDRHPPICADPMARRLLSDENWNYRLEQRIADGIQRFDLTTVSVEDFGDVAVEHIAVSVSVTVNGQNVDGIG